MNSLSSHTIAKVDRVFGHLAVPGRHADPLWYFRNELKKEELQPEEVNRIRQRVLRDVPLSIRSRLPVLTAADIIQWVRPYRRPWLKIVTAIAARAESIAQTNGGLYSLAERLDDQNSRAGVLAEIGQLVTEVIDGMGLRYITNPEQAMLCFVSASREHNRWCRCWDSMTHQKLERFCRILIRFYALTLIYAVKEPCLPIEAGLS
jgi:hypothetical protein